MNDVYFKASLQNTLNPEVGTFDNVNNKEGTFTLEDGEYYLTNNTSNSYRVYYPTKDIYSVGFTVEFDVNYNGNNGFKWLLLFNGDDSTYWHGFSINSSILRYVGNGLPDYDLITSTNIWLHVKCIFDYYLNQNVVHIYIDNVEVNKFIISNNYGIKYIDILGNSGGFVADAKIKNIIIYDSSKKHYLDTIGLTSLWSKIKSLFATKTELGSKANDSDVVHKIGDETIAGSKTFSSKIVGNLTGNADTATKATTADTATKATQDSDGNQINTTYSKNGHTHDDRYYTESEVDNKLSGKANDSDVVHKSGDETIAGSKNFTDEIKFQPSNGRSFKILGTNEGAESALHFLTQDINKQIIFGYYQNNIIVPSVAFMGMIGFYPKTSGTFNLGTSTSKWKTINGINPGALSLPDNSKLVTIDTTNWDVAGVANVYTPPTDGWLHIRVAGATELMVRWTGWRFGDRRLSATATDLDVTIPVVAGVTVDVVTVASGFDGKCQFFPCLGNV